VKCKRQGCKRQGEVRLELLLVLAVVALVFQLVPALGNITLWALDVRNWPRTAWFAVNWLVVITLVAIRFGPDLRQQWRERRERLASERATKQKQHELKEVRETLERMQQARARRIY
jgi:type VI protein secretion system component VasK